MLKKLLFIFTFFIVSVSYTQELPIAIPNQNNVTKSKSNLTFKSYTNSVESYFSNQDVGKKGSGYKPFKRWQYHWSHYLQADGTIAPAQYLWDAWEQKQKMSKSALVVSNWTAKGPFSQSSNSGQGRVNTILVDPNNANIIYVGAPAGGLWKSTDAGVHWTPLTDHLPQIGVSGIAIDPNNSNIIYISTGDDDAGDSYSVGVFKSTDGGATWNPTGNISGVPNSSNEIVIDPTNSNKVWIATRGGLFLSIDSGTTWVRKQSGNIKDFKLKPGDPNTVYAVTNDIFYKSTNGGSNFQQVVVGLPDPNTIGRLRVEVTPAAPENVYVLATKPSSDRYAFKGVYKSTNSGASFTKTNQTSDIFGSSQAWFDLAFSISPTDANTMFVGVLDIWKSTNGGDNFTKINSWFQQTASYTHADIHFLRYYNGVLFAGTDGGVYKSTNNGSTFTDLTKNMSISQFYKVSVSKQNSNSLSGGLQDNGGFSLHNNVWHNFHGGDGMDSAADPNQENTFYGFTQFGSALTKTTNGGLTSLTIAGAPSLEVGPNDNGGNWVTPLVSNKSSEIYAGYGQLYKLENGNWIKISSHPFGGDLDVIEIDPNNSNNIFVARDLNFYKSTNKGATFTYIQTSGVTGVNISSIEVHHTNSNIIWLTTTGSGNSQFPSSGYTGGSIFKSIDGGITFSNITDNLPNEAKFVIRHHPYSPNNSIYVGTALGVYYRDDITNTWEVFSTNLPNVTVSDLEINPYDNTITAATYGRSIWQSPIPAVSFPAVDLDLLGVNSPQSIAISCSGIVSPQLNVFNNGQNTITELAVNYTVDSGANQTYNWTGSIAKNSSTTIDLPAISSLADGNHTIDAEILLANDENEFNNTAKSKFKLTINQTGVAQAVNSFDNATQDKWVVSDNNLWKIGKPTTTKLNNVVASGYVTNPTGNYPDQTISYLTSPCFKLSNLENPVLKFKMAYDLEFNWDIIYMEYSIDQGTTWQILGTANDPNWYNSNTNASSGAADDCQNCPGSQWTGLNSPLKNYSYNLTALNNEDSIMFRFKFVSDPAENNEGVVIDDFVIDATAILAVNDFEKGVFSIYPNPSSAIFNIKRANGNGEAMNIQIYDVTGKLIRKKDNITDTNYPLNMQGVVKGIYFMRIVIGNKQLVKKLILR